MAGKRTIIRLTITLNANTGRELRYLSEIIEDMAQLSQLKAPDSPDAVADVLRTLGYAVETREIGVL